MRPTVHSNLADRIEIKLLGAVESAQNLRALPSGIIELAVQQGFLSLQIARISKVMLRSVKHKQE